MVYGREFEGRALSFEASGGLKKASLIMRDRESDSWWSLMTSRAIGGELEGAPLAKLGGGEKIQFGEWRRRYPDTLVLSVAGKEHDESNPYDNYFTSDRVFRDNAPEDDRLPPKANIYSFHAGGKAYAVPHSVMAGGVRFAIGEGDQHLLFYREPGSSFYASTEVYVVDGESELEELLGRRSELAAYYDGFDTFWYSWILQNPGSEILQ